jgi:hypothetical protein
MDAAPAPEQHVNKVTAGILAPDALNLIDLC